MIHISQLEFSYKENKPILWIPHLEIHEGERVFLFGPSGAGKTTLLEILSGVLRPQKGRYQFKDEVISEYSEKRRDEFRAHQLGFVFQNHNLVPYLSARQNIELPYHISSVKRGRLQRTLSEEVHFLAQRLDLQNVLDQPAAHLSLGQAQRVAVARALIGAPPLLLADEPTSSLDADRKAKFLDLLFELCFEFKTTLIFVSHDQALKSHFAKSLDITQFAQGSLL